MSSRATTHVLRRPVPPTRRRERERAPAGSRSRAHLALYGEVVRGGFVELWAHKLRSTLTLTLLMLGVFALVVMTSVLDGVMDKIATGFAGMSWDGTVVVAPKSPETTEEQKRFAMSPGLRYEDLPRIAAPNPKVLGFIPRAQKTLGRPDRRRQRADLRHGRHARVREADEPADRARARA